MRSRQGYDAEMSGRHPPPEVHPVTQSDLVRDLAALGVSPGAIVMVHTRMRDLGWVIGGPDAVVAALLEAVGPDGTVMAYAGWDQDPYHMPTWPSEVREAALKELPPFDPAVSEANRDNGRVPERIRTWPGAIRGPHPEASMVAIGPKAGWLVSPHPDDDPHGPGTPFSRLCDIGGYVLMLGAPLETITLLHHAEALADAPAKRRVTYRMPILEGGEKVWRQYEDIDTAEGAFDYDAIVEGDAFETIALAALDAGVGVEGGVGQSVSYLFEADRLVRFAVEWLESRFGA
jgi:aminoglycoside 3-N-acetyltransferase